MRLQQRRGRPRRRLGVILIERQACMWRHARNVFPRWCAEKFERGRLSDWTPCLFLTMHVTVASDLRFDWLVLRASDRKGHSSLAFSQFSSSLYCWNCEIPTRAGSCRARQPELSDRQHGVDTLVPFVRRTLRVNSSYDALPHDADTCIHPRATAAYTFTCSFRGYRQLGW